MFCPYCGAPIKYNRHARSIKCEFCDSSIDVKRVLGQEELTTSSYEAYAAQDSKGRCGVCVACVTKDLMPTGERGAIGSVKPSGWNQAKYAGIVDGNYLYNRCHLIGWKLTGDNANTRIDRIIK